MRYLPVKPHVTYRSGMENHWVSLLWTGAIYFFWLAQVFLPHLDASAPSWRHLPLTEGLSILMGIGVKICADQLLHHLLKERQENRILCVCSRIIVGFLEGLYIAGVGFHAAAFIMETTLSQGEVNDTVNETILSEGEVKDTVNETELEVKDTVHHDLHLLWGHNMFEFGYFSLLLFLACIEYFTFNLRTNEPAEGAPIVRDEPAEGAPMVRDRILSILYLVKMIFLPAIMGASYSGLAHTTLETVPLTVGFYSLSILMGGVIYCVTNMSSRVWFDSSVVTTVVISSLCGLLFFVDMCFLKDVRV